MTCIYYQDELGICCLIEGFSWDKDFKEFKCEYELKNMDDCPRGITIKLAEKAVEYYRRMHSSGHNVDKYYRLSEGKCEVRSCTNCVHNGMQYCPFNKGYTDWTDVHCTKWEPHPLEETTNV